MKPFFKKPMVIAICGFIVGCLSFWSAQKLSHRYEQGLMAEQKTKITTYL